MYPNLAKSKMRQVGPTYNLTEGISFGEQIKFMTFFLDFL